MREDESNNMLQILLHSSKGSSTEGHFTMAFALEEYNALTADKARIRLSCSESCLNVVLLTRAHWRSPVVGWWSLSLHCSCSLENFVYQSQVEANHLAQFLFCQGHEWQELQDWAQNSIDSSTFAQGVVESGIAIYFRIEFHEAWDTKKKSEFRQLVLQRALAKQAWLHGYYSCNASISLHYFVSSCDVAIAEALTLLAPSQ